MSQISKLASTILNIHIPEGQWKPQLDLIDRSGEPTLKNLGRLVFALCQLVEEIEGEVNLLKEGAHAPKRS